MALSANKVTKYEENRTRQKVPVASGAIHIYQGALLNWNTSGYVKLASDTSGEVFAGVALDELNQATGGSNGDNEIWIIPKGSGVIVQVQTGTIAVTDIGKSLYTNSDDQLELAGTTTNDVAAGVIKRVISTTLAEVQI